MDPTEDVLVLFLSPATAARDHVPLVDLDPLPLDQIGPDDLPTSRQAPLPLESGDRLWPATAVALSRR